jgi:hypothetical protein
MGWKTEESMFDFRQGREFTHSSTASLPALRPTQPPIQWAPAVISQELKCPEREYGNSFPTDAEPVFLVQYIIKEKDNSVLIYKQKR